jgi:hypothetical protein
MRRGGSILIDDFLTDDIAATIGARTRIAEL